MQSTHRNILTRLQGLIWGALAVAIICCGLRGLARIRKFKKLLVDDYFVLLALSMVFASAIIWQVFAQCQYDFLRVAAGLEMPRKDFPQVTESYLKAAIAVLILYFSAL